MNNEIEWLVGVDHDELLKLRFDRFRSIELSKTLLQEKCSKTNIQLTDAVINEKAKGLSSAIDSALNYWDIKGQSLNARILSRYYSLLQLTIAEEVSAITNNNGLKEIQKHTEQGHGLTTFSQDYNDNILNNYYCYIRHDGHFYHYLKHLNISNLETITHIKKIDKVDDESRFHLVSLADLFRRIPELNTVLEEYTGEVPLSLHFGYDSSSNYAVEEKLREEYTKKTGTFIIDVPKRETSKITTYVEIYTSSQKMNIEYLKKIDTPFDDFKLIKKNKDEEGYISCSFIHDNTGIWWDHIPHYKSSYSATTYIVPLLKEVNDPIAINYMLLYTLSIIVRYLPDMWYEIVQGKYANIGRLIDYYISIYDHVIPHQMLERITGKKLYLSFPGGFDSPV